MTRRFDEIIIIFNPNSTGDSRKNAYAFAHELEQRMPEQTVRVTATKHAGHAEDIAAKYAKGKQSVLIVSSSGDGGYNEVINGVMSTKNEKVVTAVLPSGNANDHHNALGSDNLVSRVVAAKSEAIELLKIEAIVNGKKWQRYAHSYIGFGLTPTVGRELTKQTLNPFNEKWHVMKQLMKFKHIDLTVDKTVRRFSSVVFATISQMSKMVKLAPDAAKNDGLMEIYETEYRTPWQLISVLLRASLQGLSHNERRQRYDMVAISRTLVQLDGEVFTIDKGSKITVTCQKGVLKTVL